MILATHALVGAAIGKSLGNPWLIIPAALAAHFILDTFRHGEYFDDRKETLRTAWWKVTLDILIGFSIIFFCVFLKSFSAEEIFIVLLGTFFSMFPDLLTVLHWQFKKNKILSAIKKFHGFVHRYGRFPKHGPERRWTFRNAINDIIISAISAMLLLL